MRIESIVGLIVAMSVPEMPLLAQAFPALPAPAAEQSVMIGSGSTVWVINRGVFDPGAGASSPGRSYGIQYVSRLDSRDTAALHREANIAAEHFGERL